MLINTNKSESNIPITPTSFGIKQSSVAFEILSTKLYSEPIKAIIRELLSNAYESHIAAKNEETPIEVTLPTKETNQFIVRDFGTGLSEDDVVNLYTTFFESTKNNDNTYTGGFGLGSKAPFTYTDNFTITSYFNGTAYFFIASKKDGYPVLYNTSKTPTNEKNGLKVTIPVLEKDVKQFEENLFNYIKNIPELNIFLTNIDSICKTAEEYIVINNFVPNITLKFCYTQYFKNNQFGNYYEQESGVFIKQGQNVFKVDSSLFQLPSLKPPFFCISPYIEFENFKIIFDVPVGTFPVTPNREKLIYTEECKESLKNLIEAFSTFVEKDLEEKRFDSYLIKALDLNNFNADYRYSIITKIIRTAIQKSVYTDFATKYHLNKDNFSDGYYSANSSFFKRDGSSYTFIPDIKISAKVKDFFTKKSFYLECINNHKNKELIIVVCNEKNKRSIYRKLHDLEEDFSTSSVFILNTKDVSFKDFYLICKIVKYFNSLLEFKDNIILLSENKINKLYKECGKEPVEKKENKEKVQQRNIRASIFFTKSIFNTSNSYNFTAYKIIDSYYNLNTTLNFKEIKDFDINTTLVIPTSLNFTSPDFYFLKYLMLVCNKYLYCKDKPAIKYYIEDKKLPVKEFKEYDKFLFIKPCNKKLFPEFDIFNIEEFKCWLQNNLDIYIPFKHQAIPYHSSHLLEKINKFLNLLDQVDEKFKEAFYKQRKVKILKKIRDYYFNKYEIKEDYKINVNFRFTVDAFMGYHLYLTDLMNLLGTDMTSLEYRHKLNINPLHNFYKLFSTIEHKTDFFNAKPRKDTLSEIFNLIKEKRNVFFYN